MKFITWFLIFTSVSSIPIISGLYCFSCNDLKSCAQFWNASDSERKANFTANCGKDAAGCLRGYKFKEATNNSVIELEVLQCYKPNHHLKTAIKMNNCTEVSEKEWKRTYCVCDSGDYCIAKENDRNIGCRGSAAMKMLIGGIMLSIMYGLVIQ